MCLKTVYYDYHTGIGQCGRLDNVWLVLSYYWYGMGQYGRVDNVWNAACMTSTLDSMVLDSMVGWTMSGWWNAAGAGVCVPRVATDSPLAL